MLREFRRLEQFKRGKDWQLVSERVNSDRMKLEELAAEAALLDEESRASLASRLLRSLTPPTSEIPDSVVVQRMREADDDPSVMLNHEQFLSGIKHGGN